MRALPADPLGTGASPGAPGRRGALCWFWFQLCTLGWGGGHCWEACPSQASWNPTESLWIFWGLSAKVPLLAPGGSRPLVWVGEGQASHQHSGDWGAGCSSAPERGRTPFALTPAFSPV